MNNVLANQPAGVLAGIGRLTGHLFFHAAGSLLLHPIVVLPALVYLLGGSAGQIAWYAVIAGIASGLAAPVGAVFAAFPGITRLLATILLVVQAVGFLLLTFSAIRAEGLSDPVLLWLTAAGFLLLVLPARLLLRIIDQSREYARQIVAPNLAQVMTAVAAVVAGLGMWRLSGTTGEAPADLLGRIVLPGALAVLCATWLGIMPILLSRQRPYPARRLPVTVAPGFFTNPPLMRYSAFQLINGVSRFADMFLMVTVIAALTPSIHWIGGAMLAFAAAEACARLVLSDSSRSPESQSAIMSGVLFRAVALLVAAFLPALVETSLLSERDNAELWQNGLFIAAAACLGAGYWLDHEGNARYIQSITPPSTRELTRAVIGGVLLIAAFSPLIAVRLLDTQPLEIVMRWGAGLTVFALLISPIIVRPYAQPRRRRGAWSLRRQRAERPDGAATP